MHPWYKGFKGDIIEDNKKGEGYYLVNGKFHWSENDENTLFITEIPLKKWTRDYANLLRELMGVEIIEDNDKNEKKGKKKKDKNDNDLLIKTFSLQSSISLKNMVLFGPDGKIKRYSSVEEILEIFYNIRLDLYEKRKEYMISIMKRDLGILSNKVRFIKAVISEELILKNKKRVILVNELLDSGYDTMSKLEKLRIKSKEEKEAEIEMINQNIQNEDENENGNNNNNIKQKVPAKEYDYLLTMPLWSLTYEKVEELLKQKEEKEKELANLLKTTKEKMWVNDLDEFLIALEKYEKWEEEQNIIVNKGKGKINNKTKKGNRRNNKKNKEDISQNEKNKNKTPSAINNNENNKNSQIEEIFRPTLKERLKNKKEKDFNLSNIKKRKGPIDDLIENMDFMDDKTRIIDDE